MTTKLFEVTRASIVRFGSVKPVIQPFFSWSISAEERWAIVGRVGSGKSSLGSALAGGLRWVAEDGRVSEELANPWIYRGAGSTERAVRLLAFTDNLKSYSSHSIQDRYHSRVDEDELTAAEFLLDLPKARKVYALVKDGEENPVNNATNKVIDPFAKLDDHKRQIAKKFNLEALFPLPTIRLSNGQLMRLRLAKNLLFSDAVDAKVVVLDEPFTGLDVFTRTEFANLLGDLSKDVNFPKIILLMRPQDALPSWITNVLEIDKLSVSFQGTHEEYNIRREQARSIQHAKHSEYLKARDRQSDRKASSHNDSLVPIVELNNVNVTSLDGKKILSNVDWIIHKGEKWGLTGPNGSGKTTLLAILVGDHPQAYSNPVRLFGHRRGEVGVSIWDIKDKIGFVSPEFHMHFTSRIARGHIGESEKPATTLFDAVCTGFRSGDNAALKLTQSQIDAASRIIKEFGMVDVKDYPFAKLSMGEQRVGLIMRALVKKPQLVIMDEPFQGIDEDTMTMLQAWMEREFENGQQGLVFVSHHQEEMPRFLEKFIKLADGKRVE